MVNENTDFFKIVDNFEGICHIASISVFKCTNDYLPKVTIAIPTYKRADLLKETIDSAINQENYTDYDIIVVDNNPERDCETENLMLSYSDSRLSYYKNSENLGMVGNWNRLFTLAKGEYLVMLHDDDLLLPDFLSVTMSVIENNRKIDLLKPATHSFWHEISKEEVENLPKLSGRLSRVNSFSFYSYCFIQCPTGALFKKSSVLEFGGFNPEFYPSFDYCFYAFFSKHYKVYYLDYNLILYRFLQNVTLKNTTLRGCITTDYYLVKQLLRGYNVPNFIVRSFLEFKVINAIKFYREHFNPNFEFDFKSIPFETRNLFLGVISSKLLRVVDLSVRNLSALGQSFKNKFA